jgi:protein-S-isoprenylcysteine O-methyltransferase Ste14
VKRHELDYFSLAAGLLFTVLGVLFAVAAVNAWSLDGRWVASITLIVLGAGGVAASLAANRREQDRAALAAQAPTGEAGRDDWPTDPFA